MQTMEFENDIYNDNNDDHTEVKDNVNDESKLSELSKAFNKTFKTSKLY